ncbi:biotin--[acetyl-CoA-carboxylase] ligase [Alkalihalobacillus sp. 1P02AB]|uniref:biotin--[acetyl-CoA-carboxylase] ligase n=1 Tax=Alkalihalobacillus sp. 1P02AB TaxID=3132260 RepID=UPI0039A5C2C2
MKEQLIKLLLKEPGAFVSGEKISEELGCSRTAIWKHIDALRQDGYRLESAPRKGYRLIEMPDMMKAHDIKIHLATKYIGHTIHYFDAVPTTQKEAMKYIQNGATEGELVVTSNQTNGKGRLGRVWNFAEQKAIAMSLILKPNISPMKVPQLTLLTAVAVVRALRKKTNLDISIKWPNDLLINGKKMVGILTEMQAEPDVVHSVVIGIGMNVNQEQADFSDELSDKASSLLIESGQTYKRAELIAEVLNEFEGLYDLYLETGFSVVKTLWESYAISLGSYIYARTAKETIYGLATGINDDGVLLLEDQEGQIHSIYSADIEMASQIEK